MPVPEEKENWNVGYDVILFLNSGKRKLIKFILFIK